MNSTFSPSSYLRLVPPPPPLCRFPHSWTLRGSHSNFHPKPSPLSSLRLQCSLNTTTPLDQEGPESGPGTVSVINFEDFLDKDFSFLENDPTNSHELHNQKNNQIIKAGGDGSRIMISIGSEQFVDRVIESSPSYEQLLIVHDSLLTLACIKEKYDDVKCWQGELTYIPEKFAPFDVVFLYFLPALPFELSQIFTKLATLCVPGARVVISHLQGREVLEEQRKEYPDVVVSSLPDKAMLLNVVDNSLFELVEFIDEPDFYLAVLNLEAKDAE